jgi:hypothetical protein
VKWKFTSMFLENGRCLPMNKNHVSIFLLSCKRS